MNFTVNDIDFYKSLLPAIFLALFIGCSPAPRLTGFVNPFLGTATLWDSTDLGYTPTHRAWGAEVFPGASLPNAMVQVTLVTLFGSGSGIYYYGPSFRQGCFFFR